MWHWRTAVNLDKSDESESETQSECSPAVGVGAGGRAVAAAGVRQLGALVHVAAVARVGRERVARRALAAERARRVAAAPVAAHHAALAALVYVCAQPTLCNIYAKRMAEPNTTELITIINPFQSHCVTGSRNLKSLPKNIIVSVNQIIR